MLTSPPRKPRTDRTSKPTGTLGLGVTVRKHTSRGLDLKRGPVDLVSILDGGIGRRGF